MRIACNVSRSTQVAATHRPPRLYHLYCSRLKGSKRFISGTAPSPDRNSSSNIPKIPLYIAGKAVTSSSGGVITSRHAKTDEISCEVVCAGPEEVDAAVKSSMEAFLKWRRTNPYERRGILLEVLKLLQQRFGDFRSALLADVSMSDILIGQDRRSAVNLVDGAAQTAISIQGTSPATIDDSTVITSREPFGPVLSIPAFNFPMTLALRSIVDPLACGNTVILKTSRYIPQLHALLHPLFADAGLPPGALQILHCSEENVAERVEQMIAHPDVRMVNFTGSTKLGRVLAAQCGKYLKPSVMELGGKSPAIVLESADIKLAANNVLFGALFNSGQVCMSTERVLAHESILPALEAELLEQWKQVADKPFDVVRRESVGDVSLMIEEAVKQGATRITPNASNSSPNSPGPSIISHPSPSSSIWSTETFSPTLTLTSYSTTSDLLEKLNSVPTGLSTSIFGEVATATQLADLLDSGSIHINGMTIHDEAALPFGGVRDSGWGRFNGRGAVESFTWLKNTRVVRDSHELPLGAL